ncbi:MAG: exosortase A-associated hydrolase 1 [Bacteroidia bacterium]
MTFTEQGIVFDCDDNRLVGVAAVPETPSTTAVLILVGGPQCRVGSHRQFTLLARHLAEEGYASLRFDYAGMGDSEGEPSSFEQASDDISAAIGALRERLPEVKRIVLWGLCDAASMAMIYAPTAPDIAGLVLLNPWVRQGEYLPRMRLNRYKSRFFDLAYWGRMLREPATFVDSMRNLIEALVGQARGAVSGQKDETSFVTLMRDGLLSYSGKVQVILSGNDLTASEFTALVEEDKHWQAALDRPQVEQRNLPGSDHTFSRREWRTEVETLTTDWLAKFDGTAG